MYNGLSFMVLYAAYNSSKDLLVVTLEMIGLPYLGYAVLATLYCMWGIFNLFSPGWCYYIKDYGWGFSASAAPYITLLGAGFFALVCYDSTQEIFLCQATYVVIIYIAAAVLTALGKSVLWILGCGYASEASIPSQEGRFFGIWWTIFQCSQLMGNFNAYLIINSLGTKVFFGLMIL